MTPGKSISLLAGAGREARGGSLLQPVRALLDARVRVPPRPRARDGAPMIHGRLPWRSSSSARVGLPSPSSWPRAVWMLLFTSLIIAAAILPAAPSASATACRAHHRARHLRGRVRGLHADGAPAVARAQRAVAAVHGPAPAADRQRQGWLGDVQYFFLQWGTSLPSPKADNVQGLAGTLLATPCG